MTTSLDLAALRERVRDALTMYDVAVHDGVVLRKAGVEKWSCCCPFHEERTPSCIVGGHGDMRWRLHCFGCGEDHDVFSFWEKRRGVGHVEAVKQLAGLGNVYVGDIKFDAPKAAPMRSPERRPDEDAEDCFVKPSLPSLQKPSEKACAAIAAARGLDAEAVWLAARVFGRVGYSQWPMYESPEGSGRWWPKSSGCYPSWAAIDNTLNVAEFRRIDVGEDGKPLKYLKQDGSEFKAYSTGGKKWPLGAMQAAELGRVMLVEGGPDMLAAYHFLKKWRMLRKVAVVCMLGAGVRIREDALQYFKGCRVRIMVDADMPKDSDQKSKRKMVGMEAAAKWQGQLQEIGAAVETFSVGPLYNNATVAAWHEGEIKAAEIEVLEPGLMRADGALVKDVNDIVYCSEEVQTSEAIRQAMTDWDF